MSNSAAFEGYLHIEGFDSFSRDAFDKSKVRAGMRKIGRLVVQRAQMNLLLSRGEDLYPVNRTGTTVKSISARVSRSGFMVRVAPRRTPAMKDYYPAYLHYGVRLGSRIKSLASGRRKNGERADLIAARRNGGWRIAPRANYMADAMQDVSDDIRTILTEAYAAALR